MATSLWSCAGASASEPDALGPSRDRVSLHVQNPSHQATRVADTRVLARKINAQMPRWQVVCVLVSHCQQRRRPTDDDRADAASMALVLHAGCRLSLMMMMCSRTSCWLSLIVVTTVFRAFLVFLSVSHPHWAFVFTPC